MVQFPQQYVFTGLGSGGTSKTRMDPDDQQLRTVDELSPEFPPVLFWQIPPDHAAQKANNAAKLKPNPSNNGLQNRWRKHDKTACKCAVCKQVRGELVSTWFKHNKLSCNCAVCRQARGDPNKRKQNAETQGGRGRDLGEAMDRKHKHRLMGDVYDCALGTKTDGEFQSAPPFPESSHLNLQEQQRHQLVMTPQLLEHLAVSRLIESDDQLTEPRPRTIIPPNNVFLQAAEFPMEVEPTLTRLPSWSSQLPDVLNGASTGAPGAAAGASQSSGTRYLRILPRSQGREVLMSSCNKKLLGHGQLLLPHLQVGGGSRRRPAAAAAAGNLAHQLQEFSLAAVKPAEIAAEIRPTTSAEEIPSPPLFNSASRKRKPEIAADAEKQADRGLPLNRKDRCRATPKILAGVSFACKAEERDGLAVGSITTNHHVDALSADKQEESSPLNCCPICPSKGAAADQDKTQEKCV